MRKCVYSSISHPFYGKLAYPPLVLFIYFTYLLISKVSEESDKDWKIYVHVFESSKFIYLSFKNIFHSRTGHKRPNANMFKKFKLTSISACSCQQG